MCPVGSLSAENTAGSVSLEERSLLMKCCSHDQGSGRHVEGIRLPKGAERLWEKEGGQGGKELDKLLLGGDKKQGRCPSKSSLY